MMESSDTLQIFLVFGIMSDFEGSYSWPVKTFMSQDRAEKYTELCNKELIRLREIKTKDPTKFYKHLCRPVKPDWTWDEEFYQSLKNKYDVNNESCNYEDIEYEFRPVPLDVED